MRIPISVDIEGAASTFHPGQARVGNGEYECARRWMIAEADAVVHGASDGGTINVLVNDSHGGLRNLIPDSIDRRARFVLDKPRYLSTMAGVNDCDAIYMVGYHARAGSRGVLVHTINSFAFACVWFNGQELGEAGFYGVLAGERGMPVAVASGDDVSIKGTKSLLSHTTFVEIKQAEGQNAGTSLSPEQSCEAIYAVVKATVRCGHFSMPLRLQAPTVCCLQTQTPASADLFCQWPTLERIDGTVLRFTADSVEHIVCTFSSLLAMSAMLR